MFIITAFPACIITTSDTKQIRQDEYYYLHTSSYISESVRAEEGNAIVSVTEFFCVDVIEVPTIITRPNCGGTTLRGSRRTNGLRPRTELNEVI